MGYIINDKDFINDNIFKYEKRLESQYTVFLDKNPTFVTYYHISNINSLTDNGLKNIEQVLGDNSPLKFHKIENFPIYGLDPVQLDLGEEEGVMDTMYEGESVILPNTVKPYPGDMFTISYMNKNYLFMIKEIFYDTIKSNNFYKITYYLKSLTAQSANKLNDQVEEIYNCIFKNIGTEDKCLMRDDEHQKFVELDQIYTALVDKYKTLFYSKIFNSFVFDETGWLLYDKYLTHFINHNQLFNKKEDYHTFVLSNEDQNRLFPIEYDRSIYTAIEEKDMNAVGYIRCLKNMVTYESSIFKYYNMNNVRSIMFIDTGNTEYVDDKFIYNIKQGVSNDVTPIEEVIISYFNNKYVSIYDIDLKSLDKYKMHYTYDDFVKVPMALYVLRHYSEQFMRV